MDLIIKITSYFLDREANRREYVQDELRLSRMNRRNVNLYLTTAMIAILVLCVIITVLLYSALPLM